MEYRYYMYDLKKDEPTRLNYKLFNQILFNEPIINVVHKQLNNYNDVIIYEMLSYNAYNDAINTFYLIVKRVIEVLERGD